MNTKGVVIAGVGGQGSLLASKLLGRVLVNEGYDIKVSEVHGILLHSKPQGFHTSRVFRP